MLMIDMLAFHPVRVGMLETLNWLETSSSNMPSVNTIFDLAKLIFVEKFLVDLAI
jgi:hypothetical protein